MKEQVVPIEKARSDSARKVLAACVASLTLAFAASAHAAAVGDAAAGRIKSFDCAGCHLVPGYRMAYPVVYDVPKLGGQHAAYIVSALHEYQAKQRSSTNMQAIAAGLSEQDILNLAAYFSGKSAAPAAAGDAPANPAGSAAKQ